MHDKNDCVKNNSTAKSDTTLWGNKKTAPFYFCSNFVKRQLSTWTVWDSSCNLLSILLQVGSGCGNMTWNYCVECIWCRYSAVVIMKQWQCAAINWV